MWYFVLNRFLFAVSMYKQYIDTEYLPKICSLRRFNNNYYVLLNFFKVLLPNKNDICVYL